MTTPSSETAKDHSPGLCAIVVGMVLLHLCAVCVLVRPGGLLKSEPILGADHPAHAHRVHVYREALFSSGVPWGYDPAVSAGVVQRPTQDAGAKPQELLGVVLPFLPPGVVVRLFASFAALTFPLWTVLAARRLGLSAEALAWTLLGLLTGGWLYQNFIGFFLWGVVAFAAAAYFSPLVLVLFLEFVDRPQVGTYVRALGSLSLLSFLHVLGPVVIAPILLAYTLAATPLSSRWRLAAILAPLGAAAVNSFWLIPFLLDFGTPPPPGRDFLWYPPDLTYLSVSHMVDALSAKRLIVLGCGLGLTSFGLLILVRIAGKRAAAAFGLAIAVGLLLKFGGSFVPGVVLMQPSRFLLPTFVLLTIPVGAAAATIVQRLRMSQSTCLAVTTCIVLAGVSFLNDAAASKNGSTRLNYAGFAESDAPTFVSLPRSIPQPDILDPLTHWVQANAQADDRILLQTRVQAEGKLLANFWECEVIGNTYPDLHDRAQFLRDSLWGLKLQAWDKQRLREALDRWGITIVAAYSDAAIALFAKSLGEPGESIGTYKIFRIGERGRFLRGNGAIRSDINRIELSDLQPEEGMIVLRYRYHPAWEAIPPSKVRSYPVPEEPAGFLAIETSASTATLQFNPLKMLSAQWPRRVDDDHP